MKFTRAASSAVAGIAALALLTGCSSSTSGSPTAGAAGGGKVELTFWSWVPNMDKVVDAWNASHPDVHVTYSKQAGGDSEVQKVLTAAKAHTAPDVVQAEYQEIPTLVSN